MAVASIGALGSAAGGGSGISDILGSVFGSNSNVTQNKSGTSTTNASSLDDAQIANLQNLMGILQGNDAQFSRENAINDASGFATAAFRQLKEQGLPQILANQSTAGAYNSTAGKEQANDLTARTTEQVAANTSNVVSQYAQQRAQNDAVLAQLFNILKGARTSSTTTESSQLDQNTNKEGLLTTLNPLQGIVPNPGAGSGGIFGINGKI